MKNTILLFFALVLIGFGIFLGIGIRTKPAVIEKPIDIAMTETRTETKTEPRS